MKYFLLFTCLFLITFVNSHGAPIKDLTQEIAPPQISQVYVNNVCFYLSRDENGYFRFSHYPTLHPVTEEAAIEAYTILYYELISLTFYQYGEEHDY